jgi:hypothetical protein
LVQRKQIEAGEVERLKRRRRCGEGLKQRQRLAVAVRTEIGHAKISPRNRIILFELQSLAVERNSFVVPPLASKRDRKIIEEFNRRGVEGERPPERIFRGAIVSLLQGLYSLRNPLRELLAVR